MPYRVMVDDNFHYMDEDERYMIGEYSSLAAAIAVCQHIVDRCLRDELKAGMTADELWQRYRDFGQDPFILSKDPADRFSAWKYARQRCEELCGTPE